MKKIILTVVTSLTIFLSFLTLEVTAPEINAKELIIEEIKYEEIEDENITNELSEEELLAKECEEKSRLVETIEDNKEKLIAYKLLIEEYEDFLEPPLQIYDIYSEEELNAIFSTVETEVYGCDFEEKCNIASVIFNRLESGKWGNTLQEVCYFPNQFSHWRTEISNDTILACEYVFMFGDTAQGCLFFQSSGYMDTFCRAEYVFQDNAIHYFYR